METNYRTLLGIDRETWEAAPSPINCDKITDEDLEQIAESLYDILVGEFSKEEIREYLADTSNEDYWGIDEFRWKEEEELFIKWGGTYYEDEDEE